jgi:hypothetical protein
MTRKICSECPCRTPFLADPEAIQKARQLEFEPPLDECIREIVLTLVAQGIETYESCQGGDGHAFPEPTVRFDGESSEGLRAVAVALAYGLPVRNLRRAWAVVDGALNGPWWELTFSPQPTIKNAPQVD